MIGEDSSESSSGNYNEIYPPKGSQEDVIRMDDDLANDLNNTPIDQEDKEDKEESTFDNIIPVAKLKHGWSVLSSLVSAAAIKVQTKAVETYNSETVQTYRKKTAEVVVPAWEKTCEVAAPIWENTKV